MTQSLDMVEETYALVYLVSVLGCQRKKIIKRRYTDDDSYDQKLPAQVSHSPASAWINQKYDSEMVGTLRLACKQRRNVWHVRLCLWIKRNLLIRLLNKIPNKIASSVLRGKVASMHKGRMEDIRWSSEYGIDKGNYRERNEVVSFLPHSLEG